MTHSPRLALAALACAVLAACSQTFPEQRLSADDQAFEASARTQAEPDVKLALGQLYVMHNRIDEADALLSPLVATDPGNAQALAWYGANNCKLAGRRGPWLMGLDKLYLVKRCLDQTERALALAPKDFTVQMVHIETGREVDMFGSFERARQTRDAVQRMVDAQPGAVPADALAQFHLASARIERKLGNGERASQLLLQAAALAQATATRDTIAAEQRQLGKG